VSDDFAENNLIYTLYAVFYFILFYFKFFCGAAPEIQIAGALLRIIS